MRSFAPIIRILRRYDVRSIHHVTLGEDARDAGIASRYDVMLFDRMNAGMEGLVALRAIRESGQGSFDAPALVISSIRGALEQVRGLTAGADDYVVKPAVELELVARIAACIRRSTRARTVPQDGQFIFTNGPLRLHERHMSVHFNEVEVETVKGRSFTLLLELMRAPGQPLTQDMLYERCWPELAGSGHWSDSWQGSLFTAIKRLRQELAPFEEGLPKMMRPLVVNIRNRGYILRDLSR